MMKKTILAVLMSVALLSGCSYFSWMNPWGENNEEKVYVTPKANPYLWQAALDKLSFMPLAAKDVARGTIVTGWYGEQGNSQEKFKLEVRVISNELRSDCLKVYGFKKQYENGKWVESPLNRTMIQAIELSILERARVLYQQSLENN